MKLTVIAFLCILFHFSNLYSQNSGVVVSGFVLREDTEGPVAAKITIKAPATFEVLEIIRSDEISGSYFTKLNEGNYYFIVETPGYAMYNEKVIIPGNGIKRIQKNLVLLPLEEGGPEPELAEKNKAPLTSEQTATNTSPYSENGSTNPNALLQTAKPSKKSNQEGLKIIIRNGLQFLDAKVSYAEGEDEIDMDAEEELDKLIEFMRMNQRMDVVIRGYPDRNSITSEDSLLATMRADKIKTHLVLSGIQYARLTTRPFFDFEEIADNPTHQKWRSEHMVEFRIKGSPEQEQQLEEEIQAEIEEYKKNHLKDQSSANYNVNELGEINDDHNPDNVISAYEKLLKEIEEINQKIIFFSKKSSKIEPPYDKTLDSVLQFLKFHPKVKLEIVGYASRKEGKKKIRTLPADRAFSVSSYFQENAVSSDRMKVQGSGIYNKKKDKGIEPEQEMRVEFEVVPVKMPERSRSIKGAPPKDLIASGNKAQENYSNNSSENTTAANSGSNEEDPYEQLRKNSDLKIPANNDEPAKNKNARGVQPKELNITEGIAYKVQLGAYSKPVDSSHKMHQITDQPIEIDNTGNGVYRYVCGQFKSLPEAEAYAKKIKEKGITDAFVVIYNDGKRITKEMLSEILKE